MREEALKVLQCPFSGTPLKVDRCLKTDAEGEIEVGILSSESHRFPVLGGIPIIKPARQTVSLLRLIESGEPERALLAALAPPFPRSRGARYLFRTGELLRLRGLVGAIETYWHARVKNSIVNSACTFEEALYFFFRQSAWSSLGPFNYFFYRRSDPTFVAGLALMSVVGRDGLLLDLCCGVGHFTRTLAQHRDHTTVIGFDEFFFLLYLGKRFLAPHVTFICGSANLPLPFRQREFTYAFCSDAFFDIEGQWGCARELLRTVDERGVIMLVHLHNPLWPHSYRGSHPLPARAYRNLFESRAPKFFSERTLLDDYIAERPLDLAQEPTDKELASVPAFSMIATLREGVFVRHSTFAEPYEAKALEINPLYHACREADRFLLTLEVPQEYRRDYPELEVVLPPRVEFDIALLEAARNGVSSPEVRRLLQRRILVPLPPRYLRAGTANRC